MEHRLAAGLGGLKVDDNLREALAARRCELGPPRRVSERPRVQMLALELPLFLPRDRDWLETLLANAEELSRATGKGRSENTSVGAPLRPCAAAQCAGRHKC